MKLRIACLLLYIVGVSLRAAPAPADDANTTVTSTGLTEVVSTDTTTTATFRDNVVVMGNNLRMTCDHLVVVARRTGELAATIGKQDVFQSMIATGHVVILQGTREAACGRAEILPGDDKVVLTENPVIRSTDSTFVASYPNGMVTLLRGERRVLAVPDPKLGGTMTLPPLKDLGYDPAKLTPADGKPAAPASK